MNPKLTCKPWLAAIAAGVMAGCVQDTMDKILDASLRYEAEVSYLRLAPGTTQQELPEHVLLEDFGEGGRVWDPGRRRIGQRKMAHDFTLLLRARCPTDEGVCVLAELKQFDFHCSEDSVLVRCTLERHLSAHGDNILKSVGQRYLWTATVHLDGPRSDVDVTVTPAQQK